MSFVDVGALGSSGFLAGAGAGFLVGTIAGIAAIRRRLRYDDELFRRQIRLGFNPEKPSAWLRD